MSDQDCDEETIRQFSAYHAKNMQDDPSRDFWDGPVRTKLFQLLYRWSQLCSYWAMYGDYICDNYIPPALPSPSEMRPGWLAPRCLDGEGLG